MKIAKWNEQSQTPYDIRERESVKASNGVPYSDMASLERIGYHEYQPVQLAEGEGLDNPTYAFASGVISQGGTVVSAQEMISRAQAARLAEVAAMAAAYGQRVGILATLLSRFGLELPIEPDDAYTIIEDGIAANAWTHEQLAIVPLLRDAYDRAKEVLTDNDIAAVASILGGGAV